MNRPDRAPVAPDVPDVTGVTGAPDVPDAPDAPPACPPAPDAPAPDASAPDVPAPDVPEVPDAPVPVPDAPQTLTIHIISDSVGDSAATIATAAASQFAHWECGIERLPNVARIEHIATYVEQQLEAQEQAQTPGRGASDGELVVFYTIADPDLCLQFERYIKDKNILAVDLIGPAIGAIAEATGETPLGTSGLIRRTDKDYFDRVAAMEFAVDHDDGRNPEELTSADIVLIGSSRTSKTPLSIYLAVHGYCVANVPLTPGSAPPPQLFEVEPRRIFGLTSKADLLSEIRFRRLGKAVEAAASYADPASVQSDLDEARALMRRLGCIVVRTDNRAIEETAQEILRYYETVTPRTNPQ